MGEGLEPRPGRENSETEPPRAGQGTGPGRGGSGGRDERGLDEPGASVSIEEVYFPPEVARFLGELSRALQKHAMYPPAHPALRPTISRAYTALQPLLEARTQLTVGVGRRRIAVGDAETDPRNPLLAGLADQLHAQELASVTFRTGLSEDELAEFLAYVALDPRRSGQPLGRVVETEARSWRHILLQPVRYEALGLAWARGGRSTKQQQERVDELWLILASSLLPGLGGSVSGGRGKGEGAAGTADAGTADADAGTAGAEAARGGAAGAAVERTPEELARALEEGVSDEGYARQAFGGLARASRELRGLGGGAGRGLQRRISHLISAVDPEAFGRLLGTASDRERHDLIRHAARWMEPTAVVKLVRTTAAVEGRDLSNPLLLLMAKMARYASSEAPDLAPEAEANLRDQVERLLAGWERGDDLPEPYREALRGMAFAEPEREEVRETTHGAEPEHVLRVGLLVDKAGPHVWNSATSLMQGRQFRELVDALGIASPGSVAAQELWEELATPKAVDWILQAQPEEEEGPDLEVLDHFVSRLGPGAASPMLDALGRSESPELRKGLFSRLERLGPAIAPDLLERLEDGRWWVRRNALALLGRVGGWPASWSPHKLARDSRPEVRIEALSLLLQLRDRRDRALCDLLSEPGPRAVELGLRAAQEDAPPEAVPLLLDVLDDEEAATGHRVLAVRALAALSPPGLPEPLTEIIATLRGGLFRLLGPFRPLKLKPKSALTLEALAALARGWRKHPAAAAVLRKARNAHDEEVKAAAYGKLLRASVGPAGEPGPGGSGGPAVADPAAATDPAADDHVPGPEDSR